MAGRMGAEEPEEAAGSFVQWPLRDLATRSSSSRKSRATAGSPTKQRTPSLAPAPPTPRMTPPPPAPAATRTDVFLGGACNPTTWRREVAVPLLEAARVRYYNPQVDEWYAELIELERRAMETATVLLNVIDDATRALVSINEAVEFIFRGHRVVLVVEDLAPGARIEGDAVSPDELAELNAARQSLRDLARARRVPVCSSVREAVLEAIRLVQAAAAEGGAAHGHALEAPRLRERSAVVLGTWAAGRVRPPLRRSLSEASIATLSLGAGARPPATRAPKRSSSAPSSALEEPSPAQLQLQHLIRVSSATGSAGGGCVYLAGNANAACWRDNAAARLLQRAGVPFLTPLGDYLTFEPPKQAPVWATDSEATSPVRVDTSDRLGRDAELILFVIPKHRGAIAAMTEAVELVMRQRALLLVVEPVTAGSIVTRAGSPVAGRELKDLVRARAYLHEMAERCGVKVFPSVAAAVADIVESA